MKLIILSLSILSVLCFSSCKKVAGPGGSSTITGKIHAKVYDGAGNLLTEYDIAKEDVFIIYGSGSTAYDDKVKTSYDGTFKFNYLEKGSYQVFVYEKDPTVPSGVVVKIVDAQITSKKSTVDLGTINIRK